MSLVDVRERVRDSPDRARSLLTVRAAISSARPSPVPRSSWLSLMCSYCRARLVPFLTPRGGTAHLQSSVYAQDAYRWAAPVNGRNQPSVRRDDHIRCFDHGPDLLARLEPELVSRLDRDRRDQPLPGYVELDVRDRLSLGDRADCAGELVPCAQLHLVLLARAALRGLDPLPAAAEIVPAVVRDAVDERGASQQLREA